MKTTTATLASKHPSQFSLLDGLQQLGLAAFQQAFPALEIELSDIEMMPTKDAKLGDYQCNSAMRFSKRLGQNPRLIAEQVKPFLAADARFAAVEVAGPGFINLTVSPVFLETYLKEMRALPKFGLATPAPQKIIVDFSSPNVAKEMHVGHLRTTIIGDCLARVFEFLGHDVLRLNHIGDWGTAFGMLIAHMEECLPEVLQGTQEAQLIDLMQWYRASKKRFDEEPEFKKRAQLKVVALQQGDPATLAAWQKICAISEVAYQAIYDLLDIHITPRGESFYNPYLAATVEDLTQKGLVTESDGARCVFIDGFIGQEGEPLPFIVQKSDGGYNYASTDIAALWHRSQIEKAERIIYVVDAGQSTHLAMLFAVAERAGYLKNTRAEHVPFGLVLGADGKKFKTRSGDTEKLIDLLTRAIEEAQHILQARDPNDPDVSHKAKVLGINAVKYADLSSNRIQDYRFSYDKMLQFEGNTAAYIMYSLVRVLSIQRKVGKPVDPAALVLTHPAEKALALHLARFKETIEYVARALYPHRLTDYLYELANHFNAFFRDCRVDGDAQEASRLVLCALSAEILASGLQLLGLKTLERM